MSFVVVMVVGHLDADAAIASGSASPARPLTADEVDRLDAVCREIMGPEHRFPLAAFHKDGVLRITAGILTGWMYGVACVAHEVFGMNAVDMGHRIPIYPETELERLEEWRRAEVRREGALTASDEFVMAWTVRDYTAFHQLRDRVRAWVAAHRAGTLTG